MRNISQRKPLLFTRMAEASCTALCFVESFDSDPFRLFVTGDNQLSNAFTIVESYGCVGEVDEHDANFASVVRINGSGGV